MLSPPATFSARFLSDVSVCRSSMMSTTSPRLNSPSWLRSYFCMICAASSFDFALFSASDASASTAALNRESFESSSIAPQIPLSVGRRFSLV